MADTPTNPARAGALAQKIVNILSNEDSVTRRRAVDAALMLLGEPPSSAAAPREDPDGQGAVQSETTFAKFFDRDEKLKPADNAQLCAAYHYSLYGSAAFSVDEIRTIGKDAGVVLPDRLDMTFQGAAKKGKKLFQSTGRGVFRPTAAAGLAFSERWQVKPGTRAKG